MTTTVAQLVAEAMEHGSLFAAGRGRTVTVAGRRRYTIRLQNDIYGAHYGIGIHYYPDLAEQINRALTDWKALHHD